MGGHSARQAAQAGMHARLLPSCYCTSQLHPSPLCHLPCRGLASWPALHGCEAAQAPSGYTAQSQSIVAGCAGLLCGLAAAVQRWRGHGLCASLHSVRTAPAYWRHPHPGTCATRPCRILNEELALTAYCCRPSLAPRCTAPSSSSATVQRTCRSWQTTSCRHAP